ncbi:MAG: ABC transporter permease subunit [Acutalibacter sp.]|nr:ABC transporter permease subunit [Acutalibacter sp.]
MRKLLSANFRRLWRSKILWVIIAGVLLYSIFCTYMGISYTASRVAKGLPVALEDNFFEFMPYTGALFGLFVRLFLGPDHHEGTLRNKLVVGHSRRDIFLSNFVVCFIACSMIMTAFFLFGLLEMTTIGPFAMGVEQVILYFLIALGTASVFAALFTWINAISTNPALTALYVTLLWIAMALLSSGLFDRLAEPEMTGGTSDFVMAFVGGEFVELPSEPNPMYLSGWVRTVCEFFLDALPTGQSLQMCYSTIEHPVRELVSSLVITVAALVGGIFHFNRKDLK